MENDEKKKPLVVTLEVSLYEAASILDGLRIINAQVRGTIEDKHITALAMYILGEINKVDPKTYQLILDSLMPKPEDVEKQKEYYRTLVEKAKTYLKDNGVDFDKTVDNMIAKNMPPKKGSGELN